MKKFTDNFDNIRDTVRELVDSLLHCDNVTVEYNEHDNMVLSLTINYKEPYNNECEPKDSEE